jgi:hypothetical protein
MLMGFVKEKTRLLCLSAALLTVLAWPAHEVFGHNSVDNDCQICAVSLSPELNADCGSALLAAPENFSLLKPEAALLTVITATVPVFYGRAPPAL